MLMCKLLWIPSIQEENGATGNKGLAGLLGNPVLSTSVAGLATAATGFAAVEVTPAAAGFRHSGMILASRRHVLAAVAACLLRSPHEFLCVPACSARCCGSADVRWAQAA